MWKWKSTREREFSKTRFRQPAIAQQDTASRYTKITSFTTVSSKNLNTRYSDSSVPEARMGNFFASSFVVWSS